MIPNEAVVSILTKEIHKEKQEYILQNSKSATITENGETEIVPNNDYDAIKKVVVTTAIPLESNKSETIDVSQYSDAVEITPTSGKTAMEKTTVTLSNIPQIEANKEASITQNGTVEITPTSGKQGMAKTTVTVNVPQEFDIESNKSATIDVSEYTDPVEITPTQGKDGMAKATITLSNIPSPSGSVTLYAWSTADDMPTPYFTYTNIDSAPTNPVVGGIKFIEQEQERPDSMQINSLPAEGDVYTKVSDTEFTISWEEGGQTYTQTFTRSSGYDITLWS